MGQGKPLMNTDVITTRISAPGQASFTTLNGTLTTDPAFQSWDNDLGSGSITMNTRRMMNLQDSQETLLNFSHFIGGTSHTQSGGGWVDVGTPFGHTGVAQNNATATNDEYFALVSQFPNRDDGTPIQSVLPTLEENMKKVANASGAQKPIILPTITRFSDVGKYLSAITDGVSQQLDVDVQAQTRLAMDMCQEDLEEQKKEQKKLLVAKYGEEAYEMYFRAGVEAGYIYIKDELPWAVTKDDLIRAALADGKANRRTSWEAKV